MAHTSLYSFAVLAVLGSLAWHSLGNRDADDTSITISNVAADPPKHDPDMNPMEAIQKIGDIVKAAAQMKRIKADNARKTANIAKALGLLVDAKKRVKAAMLQHGSKETLSVADVLPKGFSESLRNALAEAGAVNTSHAANKTHEEALSAVQVGTSGKSDSLLSLSGNLDIPSRFSALVQRVTNAASKVESDAAVLHGMNGRENKGKLNHMLTSLTKAAKFVQNTAQTLGDHAPSSPEELESVSDFLLEAERNMGMTSQQLSAMKGRLAEMDRHRVLHKQGPSLLALHGSTSQHTSHGHQELEEGSILHQSEAKLSKKLNRKLHQLAHASKQIGMNSPEMAMNDPEDRS
mmetsp:Transcript_10573/g.19511  ORF Transcript_10573/g.19511 Transcript_10573/m.19511 type:complete len:349 (+) Transcript_10573:72-1118(+)